MTESQEVLAPESCTELDDPYEAVTEGMAVIDIQDTERVPATEPADMEWEMIEACEIYDDSFQQIDDRSLDNFRGRWFS